MNDYQEESIFIDLKVHKLHLKRMYSNENAPVIFMLHGSIENGRIFYSKNGKGLAPFLAKNGFDIFIADLRGRGESQPAIDKNSEHGQNEIINEDIPAFINKIIEIKGDAPQQWIAHSWGGVMLASYFARHKEHRHLVKSMVFFGTKRVITAFNFEKIFKINFVWNNWSKILIKKHGFLPAQKMGFGSDNETANSYNETNFWVKGNKWIDPKDNFNYQESVQDINFPPLLSITGIKDKSLGHPKDVESFIKEISPQEFTFKVLGKKAGNKNDYDHINILTHQDAVKDQFIMILDWLKKYNSK